MFLGLKKINKNKSSSHPIACIFFSVRSKHFWVENKLNSFWSLKLKAFSKDIKVVIGYQIPETTVYFAHNLAIEDEIRIPGANPKHKNKHL